MQPYLDYFTDPVGFIKPKSPPPLQFLILCSLTEARGHLETKPIKITYFNGLGFQIPEDTNQLYF